MEKVPETKISLRLFNLFDADDYLAWESDERVMKYLRRELRTSRDSVSEYISSYIMNHPWCRAICIDNRPVGSVSVWPHPDKLVYIFSENGRKASIGYCIRYDHWGRGIASVAVKKAVKKAFEELPELERLEATVNIINIASVRVLEKAGFVREGLLRKYTKLKGDSVDVFMFSFLSTDLLVD